MREQDGAGVNKWQFASIGAVLAALVLVVLIVVLAVDASGDVAAILGVVTPALVSIAAAVLGKLAYDAGRATGTTVGEARGAAGKAQEVRAARQDVAQRILAELQSAGDAVEQIVSEVRRVGSSPAGSDTLRLSGTDAGAPLEIPIEQLAAAPRGLHAAQAVCRAYLDD